MTGKVEVAIIGGGPAGLAAAMALRDAGVRVGLNPTEAGEHMADIVADLG